MSRSLAVAGSSFTLELDFGYRDLLSDGGGLDQYLETFALYFDDPASDGGTQSAVFVKVDPVQGVELLLQTNPTTNTDGTFVVPQPTTSYGPTHLRLHVEIGDGGSAKATLAGLTTNPVALDGSKAKTQGHFAPMLRELAIGDTYVADHVPPGAVTRFDNVVLTQP